MNVTNSFVVLNGPWGGWGVPSTVVTVVGDVVRAMCVMVRPLSLILLFGYCVMFGLMMCWIAGFAGDIVHG